MEKGVALLNCPVDAAPSPPPLSSSRAEGGRNNGACCLAFLQPIMSAFSAWRLLVMLEEDAEGRLQVVTPPHLSCRGNGNVEEVAIPAAPAAAVVVLAFVSGV